MRENEKAIYSMTGFGRGEAEEHGIRLTAEIRSLNNRYFDFGFRASRSLQNYEIELRELCRRQVDRGRLTLLLTESRSAEAPPSLNYDENLASHYVELLRKLNNQLGLAGQVELKHLLTFSDLFAPADANAENNPLLKLAKTATERALEDLRRMRAVEGKALADDMKERLSAIRKAADEIEVQQQGLPQQTLDKLKARLSRLHLPENFDPYRLELELALLVDRMDITEECVRLRSHEAQFLETLESPPAGAGKRLGFLLQEMNREANTIASKAGSLDISHLSVSIREEIEKLREQVQNIE
ncbi:YicC family protein [bacterium]|nr:YicC family protein [bacterium]